MQNTIVLGEYDGSISREELEDSIAPKALDAIAGAVAATGYLRLDGDATYTRWLLLELDSGHQSATAAAFLSQSAQRTQAYREVWRMDRDEWRVGRRVSSYDHLDTSPESLLTVVLPVPEGRSVEWNRWYDYHHMPTVFGIAPGIEIGHRFAPITDPSDGTYLVAYEFRDRAALDEWQSGSTVSAKHDEYFNQWSVRNVRRAFTREFRSAR
jgi:hypothetical protein